MLELGCGSAPELAGVGIVVAALVGEPTAGGVHANELAGVVPNVAAAVPITVAARISTTTTVNSDRPAGPQAQPTESIHMPV